MLTSILTMTSLLMPTGDQSVQWIHGSLGDAIAAAKPANKMILVYCWADGSEFCGKLYQETLAHEATQDTLSEFVCFNAKHGGEGMAELYERFAVKTLPTMLFLDPSGKPEDLITGFIPAADFVKECGRIRSHEGTVTGFRTAMQEAEALSTQDIEARWQLAGKLQLLGDQNTHDVLMESIERDDPEGKTTVGARVRLQSLVNEIFVSSKKSLDGAGDGGEGKAAIVKDADLKPLYAFAKTVGPREAKFEVWDRIGNLEFYRNDAQAAFKAYQMAAKLAPDERFPDWAAGIASWVVKHADERTSKERKFAMKLAADAVKRFQGNAKALADAGKSDADIKAYLAHLLNTLAWTQHVSGKQAQAVVTAKKACELSGDEKYLKDLEAIAAAGN